MSYIPTNWRYGDLISSERLNHAEQGISTGRIVYLDVDIPSSQSNSFSVETQHTIEQILSIVQNGNLPVFNIINSCKLFIRGIDKNINMDFFEISLVGGNAKFFITAETLQAPIIFGAGK